MGLFDFFAFSKTNYLSKMREYLQKFMLDYIKEFPMAADDVMPIFSNANEMIGALSEREVAKTIKNDNMNIEYAVLNIVQNMAMMELKQKPALSFLKDDDHPLELYKYVNDIKFNKGYISKEQYDENNLLATKLSLISPLGEWY